MGAFIPYLSHLPRALAWPRGRPQRANPLGRVMPTLIKTLPCRSRSSQESLHRSLKKSDTLPHSARTRHLFLFLLSFFLFFLLFFNFFLLFFIFSLLFFC